MDDWVLDSLVGFLQSPMWGDAVNSFIENQCVVFDPGEENKFSYTDSHKEYQKMVEELLEGFTTEIGITTDQFIQACTQLMRSQAGQENEDLFDQVLAADDFLLFKAVMVHKNIDLELQALDLLRRKLGYSLTLYDKDQLSSGEGTLGAVEKSQLIQEEEEKDLEEALKLSLERSREEEELERQFEQAKAESLRLYQQSQGHRGGGRGEGGGGEKEEGGGGVGERGGRGEEQRKEEESVSTVGKLVPSGEQSTERGGAGTQRGGAGTQRGSSEGHSGVGNAGVKGSGVGGGGVGGDGVGCGTVGGGGVEGSSVGGGGVGVGHAGGDGMGASDVGGGVGGNIVGASDVGSGVGGNGMGASGGSVGGNGVGASGGGVGGNGVGASGGGVGGNGVGTSGVGSTVGGRGLGGSGVRSGGMGGGSVGGDGVGASGVGGGSVGGDGVGGGGVGGDGLGASGVGNSSKLEHPLPHTETQTPRGKLDANQVTTAADEEEKFIQEYASPTEKQTHCQTNLPPIKHKSQLKSSPPPEHHKLPQTFHTAAGVSGADAVTKWLEGAKSEAQHSSAGAASAANMERTPSGPTPEELKAREQYLRQQRDRLLEMKRAQRAHNMQAEPTATAARGKPRTAREDREKAAEKKKSPHGRGGRDVKHGGDTGVLSSTIAGSLKRSVKPTDK